MTATSARYAELGPRLRWPTVLRVVLVAWCTSVALAPLLVYAWAVHSWPMLPELHALLLPAQAYLSSWGLNCGLAAVCAVLLVRRSRWAAWPMAALVAWRVGFVGWHTLRGSLDAIAHPSAVWLGLASHVLALAAIVVLRQKRVLR